MEERAVESFDDGVCRLCAHRGPGARSAFHPDPRLDLVAAVRKHLSIEIAAEDELPVSVCSECRERTISFASFYRACTEAQTRLRELAANAVKTEDESIATDASIKSEPSSCDDGFDVDDFVPISKFIVKKRSRKISDHLRNKKSKKIRVKEEHTHEKDESEVINNQYSERKHDIEEVEDIKDKFKLKIKLEKNVKTHSDTFIKYICHICNNDCEGWHGLKLHTKNEHDEKPKVLCICNQYLYTRHAINRHIVKHDKTRGIKCENCDKKFTNLRTLQKHNSVHLPKDQLPHVCIHCAKRFATIFTLKAHEKTHLPKELRYIHPCDVCGTRFTSKASMKSHISAVHENNRPFVCDVCGHMFNNKGNLLEHRSLHSEEKTYTCPKCPKSFKTKGTLKRHIDCHAGTSYKCIQCPAILNSRRTLRMHMYVHEKHCRYICGFCNKGYKRRKSLKSHMNIHTGERPFTCPWCSRTFADNSNCRIHKKRMHPVELAEYEAIHGPGQEVTKNNTPEEEKKIICHLTFKVPETKTIVYPMIEIQPYMSEINESQL